MDLVPLLTDGVSNSVTALSEIGQLVAGNSFDGTRTQGYIWKRGAATATALGVADGYVDSMITGMNDEGTIVVGNNLQYSEEREIVLYEGFIWTEKDGMQPISEDGYSTRVTGISGNGEVIVGCVGFGAPACEAQSDFGAEYSTVSIGFSRSVKTGDMQLYVSSPKLYSSALWDISGAGDKVVGDLVYGTDGILPLVSAAVWDYYEFPIPLTGAVDLSADMGGNSARAISSDGEVYAGLVPSEVDSLTQNIQYAENVYRWSLDAAPLNIAPLGFPAFIQLVVYSPGESSFKFEQGYATAVTVGDISDDGNVIVGTVTVPNRLGELAFEEQPFMWTEDGGVTNLMARFAAANIGPVIPFTADAVSGDGSIVAGTGKHAGSEGDRAYVASLGSE
jgi:uncharacterized membrane protein